MKNDKINILIAEDDYLVGEEIKRLLFSKEYNIVGQAINGLEAVEMCCSLKPDIVLMDLKMPKLNGLDATEKIQELNPTPVIILTAHETNELIYKASKIGASAFLVKPPKINEIERAIFMAIERHNDFLNIKNLNILLNKEIDNRIASEEALKKSEEEYRLIIENSREAIIITQDDKLVFINNAYVKLLGYNENDLSNFKKFPFPLNNNENSSFNYETILQKEDGTNIDIDCSERTITFREKLSKFTIIRDITKQKKIMKKLQEAAKQIETLDEIIPICAGCHLIRDDDQDDKPWISPDSYFFKRLPNVLFSHGMCPDCMKKWYPEFASKTKS